MTYNKKIIFQVLTETADKIGWQSPEWTDIFTAWANVNSQNDVLFKIRYSRKIAGFLTPEIRILYNGRIYDVKHIDDYQEQHRQLVFRTEVHNGGHN